ncbi:MAG TPA: phosphate acyltransferase PlsX [Gammaproteobacteria bacterium]|nr:phosphate acyltransferase PlsX [Gammaproteobacteria bacterium]
MASICIALDAMGGDHGPRVIVPAAVDALTAYPNLQLILVGNRNVLEEALRTCDGFNHSRLQIREASQVVNMGDSPAEALRHKRDSSLRVAINLVKEGVAEACVSAGNTGALMATARFVLKMLPGVDRPAITYSLPTMKGHVHMLDLGANVNCLPEDLFQFAIMGSVLARAIDNNLNPTVGLLNVGSEAIKGSEQVKKAAALLTNNQRDINYIGFVEGDDIYKGTADVVVCDGFVGNVALKTSEGLAKMVLKMAKEEFMRSWYGRLAGFIASPILRALTKRLDPNQYNGASLLGLKGIVIKSHGNAEQKAFGMAIRVAMLEVEKNIPARIQKQLAVQLGHMETA